MKLHTYMHTFIHAFMYQIVKLCIHSLLHYNYIGSANSEDQEVGNCDVQDDKNTLRRSVEGLFNRRYG